MNKIRTFQQMEFAQRLDLILFRVVLMACQNDATELASASIGHGVSLQHPNTLVFGLYAYLQSVSLLT